MTTPARILVVDDTDANVRVFEAMLTARGHEVLGSSSGPEALELLGREAIDLVLLDVNMPGMNGYEVCRRIREAEATAVLPIVMVTAAGDEERVRALEAGADDFLRRPFDQPELLARVASLLRIKRYHDELRGQAAELQAWNQTLEDRVRESVEELEVLRALRRFLSPQLAGVVQASGAELLAPHRREVAVLCCRLQRFAAFVAVGEPEEVLEVLAGFHEALGAVVAEHGATVGSSAAEDMTLFFNDPVPCDDPAARALAAATDLRRRLAPLLDGWAARGRRLDVAAGISLGYATLGAIGFEGRYDYAAVGPVVTVAAGLLDVAGDGQVLVSASARSALGDDCGLEPLGAVRVAGFADPVEAWAVATGAGGHAAAVPPRPAGPSTVPAPPVEIAVLGPLEVRRGGEVVPVTAAKERALLAVLATHRGTVVSVDRLTEEVWAREVPGSGTSALRVYVSRLRKTLAAGGLDAILVTRPTGYALDVPAEAVDANRFEALARQGRTLLREGDAAGAAEVLRAALALWRGPALAEVVDAPVSGAAAVRLEEERLAATEDWIDAELATGGHRDVVGHLEGLTAVHPLRERLWGQRMVALHRSGRQPEAIRVFQDLRRSLGEGLGLEPSPALVALERAIVAGADDVAWPPD